MTKRQINSILTFTSEMIFKVIITLLGIIKTNLLIHYMGSSVNGLYQLVIQLLTFVTIADLGLDSLYRYSYYKPLYDNNPEKVNELYNGSKRFYFITGLVMIVFAILVSFLFPVLANSETNFSPFMLFVIMFLFSLPSIVESFSSADISLVSAQQKNFLVHTINNIKFIVRLIASIVTIATKDFMLFIIVDSFIAIAFTVFRLFALRKYNKAYKGITNKIDNSPIKLSKYVLLSSINNNIYMGTDNIILSQILGFVSVSIYSSYYFVISSLSSIITSSIGSIIDSLGDLFASNDNYKDAVFFQLDDLLFYISISLSVPLFLGLRNFIRLAITSNPLYQINSLTYNCFVLLFIIIISTFLWDVLVKAKGLYQETWMISLLESSINIFISIILVYKLGIAGALIGTILAKVLKTIMCNFHLCKILSFNTHALASRYVIKIIYTILLFVFLNYFNLTMNNLIAWLGCMVVISILSFLINFIICFILFSSIRNSLKDFIQYFVAKKK